MVFYKKDKEHIDWWSIWEEGHQGRINCKEVKGVFWSINSEMDWAVLLCILNNSLSK